VHLYPGEKEDDTLAGAARTAAAELDLNDSIASGAKIDATEGLKVEADETKRLEANFEDGGPDADSARAPQDESDDYYPPSNLASLFDMMGIPNYAALTRWLDDHDLSGLRIVAREGLDEDADDSSPESFLKLGIILHEEGNLPAAERAFRMAIHGRPTNPEPYLYFGKMLEESGHVLGAEMMYRKANLATPDFAEAFKNFIGAELYARHPSLRHNPEHPSRSGGRGDAPTEIAAP
jgi:tetratricopeptide (TPR) repeat protein